MRARPFLAGIVTAGAVAIAAAAVVVYAGAYDVGASDAHWGVTRRILEAARTRSIQAHAAGIAAPPSLDDPAKIAMGVAHYAAHCAICHGAPGVPPGEIAEGMYPKPPDLVRTTSGYSDGELFWILKHGIKMTGMPSWADHGDDELWATVAFLKKLRRGMTEAQYADLIKANMMNGMEHYHGAAPVPTPGH